MLAGLKDGLQARLGERGFTLSGGQRQRVSLARALAGRVALLKDGRIAAGGTHAEPAASNLDYGQLPGLDDPAP